MLYLINFLLMNVLRFLFFDFYLSLLSKLLYIVKCIEDLDLCVIDICLRYRKKTYIYLIFRYSIHVYFAGRILLKGDNITLIQQVQWERSLLMSCDCWFSKCSESEVYCRLLICDCCKYEDFLCICRIVSFVQTLNIVWIVEY